MAGVNARRVWRCRTGVICAVLALPLAGAGGREAGSLEAFEALIRNCDPARPSASLATAIATCEQWSGEMPGGGRGTRRSGADTGASVRARLAVAMAHVLRGSSATARRLLAPIVLMPAATLEERAFANVLFHLADGKQPRGASSVLATAADLYRRAGNTAGLSLALGMRARYLAGGGEPEPASATGVAAKAEALLASYEGLTAKTARPPPLADVNAAWACCLLGDSIGEGPNQAEARKWYLAAERVARRAEASEPDSVTALVARNLRARAWLQPVALGLIPTEATLNDRRAEFESYLAATRADLLKIGEPRLLLLGVRGLLDNLGSYGDLLLAAGQDRAALSVAKTTVALSFGAMRLVERAPAKQDGLATALGVPMGRPAAELGIDTCLAIERQLGDGQPEEGPVATYGELAFWLYDRIKAGYLSRVLARIGGESRLGPDDRRRRQALSAEWNRLAVESMHLRLGARADTDRASSRISRGDSKSRGRRSRRAQPPQSGTTRQRLRELSGSLERTRAELLRLELGGDEEARAEAALLSTPWRGGGEDQLFSSSTRAALVCGYDWAYVLRRGEGRWRGLDPPGSRRAVAALVAQVGDPKVAMTERIAASRRLYDAYLKPLEPDLAGVDSLVVIPEPPLAALPFEALMPADLNGIGWPAARFFGDLYRLSYASSLTMLRLARHRAGRIDRRRIAKAALAIGAVRIDDAMTELVSDDSRFVFVPQRGGEGSLTSLPYTGEEARAVVEAVGGDASMLLLGDDATEARVVAEMPRYALLHFATHGLLPSDGDPLGAGLLLSPGPSGEAGVLTAREVYGFRLPARLAVLSACDTARGKSEYTNAGVTSLARAFLYAGVPSVVASLWPVDDQATAALMGYLYEHELRRPADPDAALAEAKRALRREQGGRWADPYYWAPFLIFH